MSSLEDFFFGDKTLLIPRVYPESQVFTIMICLQQDALSQNVDYTIENNLYSSLNRT